MSSALVNRKCNKYDETTRNVRVLIYVKWSVGSHTDKATPRCALPVTLQFLRTQGNDSRAAAPDSPQHPTSCTSYSYIGPHGLRPYERHPRNTTANTTTHEFHQTGFCAPCATKIDRHSATCCGHVGSWKESEQGTSPLASHLCRIGSVQGITPTTRYLDCRPSWRRLASAIQLKLYRPWTSSPISPNRPACHPFINEFIHSFIRSQGPFISVQLSTGPFHDKLSTFSRSLEFPVYVIPVWKVTWEVTGRNLLFW